MLVRRRALERCILNILHYLAHRALVIRVQLNLLVIFFSFIGRARSPRDCDCAQLTAASAHSMVPFMWLAESNRQPRVCGDGMVLVTCLPGSRMPHMPRRREGLW